LARLAKNNAMRSHHEACTGVNTNGNRFGRVAQSARGSRDVWAEWLSHTPGIFVSGPYRASKCLQQLHTLPAAVAGPADPEHVARRPVNAR